MASIRILISSSAAGVANGFNAVRNHLTRLAANARVAANRMRNAFIAGGGLPGFLGRQISAAGRLFRNLPNFARSAATSVIGVFQRMGNAISSAVSSAVSSIRSSFSRIGSGVGGVGGGTAGGGGVAGAAAGVVSMLGVLPQMALYATAIVHLTALVGNLLPLLQLVAPAAVAAGAGLAVFKMATNGIADALKAGMDGDIDKLNEALRKLSPSAKSAVLTLLDLQREWRRTQRAVQEKFWEGARNDFIKVSRALQPVADRWLPRIATAFANVRTMISNVLTTAAKAGQLDKIMAGVHQFFTGLLGSVPFLIRALLDVAEVAAPSFGELGEGIGGAAKKFADWIRDLKEDGTLKRWLDEAKEIFGQVMDVFKEVGRIIAAIFEGGQNDTEDFLTNLRDSLSDLAGWLESDDGQATLHFIADIGSALAGVITWIAAVVGWFRSAWDWIAARTEGLRDSLAGAFGAIAAAVGFAAGIIGTMAGAFGWIEGIIGRLGNLANAIATVSRAAGGVSSVTGNIGGSIKAAGKGILKGFASGGHPRGLSWVGEHGPELADFGATGRVYGASQSREMAAAAIGGSGPATVITVSSARGAGADPLADAIMDLIRRGKILVKVNTAGRLVSA